MPSRLSTIDDFAPFRPFIDLWDLRPDGEPIATHAARLLPVRHGSEPAMLKVSVEADEKRGALLMRWWDGVGAARVLAAEGDAVLLERAMGSRSLKDYSRNGHDDEATAILCDATAALHAQRDRPPPELTSLDIWFKDLISAAHPPDGPLARCKDEALGLLADQRDVVVLHGDIHHDNVLDFGKRGWLAIDPKHLVGERGFDYANIFCNPDVGDADTQIAVRPETFARRLDIVTERAGLDRARLLRWIIAWCGLSAAWFLGDGQDADIDFAIARLAIEALERP